MIWLVTAPATEDEEKGVGLAFVFEDALQRQLEPRTFLMLANHEIVSPTEMHHLLWV
jgi:hypothetical protein